MSSSYTSRGTVGLRSASPPSRNLKPDAAKADRKMDRLGSRKSIPLRLEGRGAKNHGKVDDCMSCCGKKGFSDFASLIANSYENYLPVLPAFYSEDALGYQFTLELRA
ncbi:MAG: hypothetical protein HY912_07255, partial [Desulfomonile tiedjei]|nr:hypothetical protein [Desulfomonile tiedjei]